MERSLSKSKLLLMVATLSAAYYLISADTSSRQTDGCICPQELLNFTIRRVFCGAELLSDSCEKNAIYKCEPNNNITHNATRSDLCKGRWSGEAWCGLRCRNRWSYSCTPKCMDIERADQSYRKVYKYDEEPTPDYTPWGNRTPHIWIL